jgi:hypothetical protein
MMPRLAARLGTPATDVELCGDTKLGQLPPRPKRMILAVAFSKPLEGPRVLPKVRFVKELRITNVLALGEPITNSLDALDRDGGLAFEIPSEVMPRTRPELVRGDTVIETLPRLETNESESEEKDRAKQEREESTHHLQECFVAA